MTDTAIHSTSSGPDDGPVLLLLNSLGATLSMWDPQIDRLSAQYRVIRCDTRGHGASPTPQPPYAFDDLVGDALAVLDRHGADRATVIGLSLGGMTALGLGLTAPDRIDRVICCAARADAPPAFVQTWQDRLATLDDGGIEAVWAKTVGMWLSDATRRTHPKREAALRAAFLQTTEDGYRGCARALMGLDYLRRLGEMTVPTHFIAGEADMAAAPSVMREMADACPGADFAVVPEAKHLIGIDNPRDFTLALVGPLGLDPA